MNTNKKILLHACCGPCATHCIEALRKDGIEPVLFFSNSNIMPEEEYNKRLEAIKKLAELVAKHGGLWNAEAEAYLLSNIEK